MPNIVVLDGLTLNPGDLAWTDLDALGPCQVFDRTEPSQILARAAQAEIVLTNKARLTREEISRLPNLRYIGVLATGTNVVDPAAARERGILVTNVPNYGTPSVAQATWALLLELTNHVGRHAQGVREGRWSSAPDFCYWDAPLVELDGLVMGIVGFGRIGAAVGRLARAFGMRVLAFTRRRETLPDGVRGVDLETLFRESDVLSLHCPQTPDTTRLVNAERLSWMKPTAFLLNTSRGALIDEPALADALNQGRLAGAGLDVLSLEPPPATNPLLSARNCIITPHHAWAARAARQRLLAAAIDNIRAFLAGKPTNVVSG